jgi:hypothetical protein
MKNRKSYLHNIASNIKRVLGKFYFALGNCMDLGAGGVGEPPLPHVSTTGQSIL